jgi:hypothetical protein
MNESNPECSLNPVGAHPPLSGGTTGGRGFIRVEQTDHQAFGDDVVIVQVRGIADDCL